MKILSPTSMQAAEAEIIETIKSRSPYSHAILISLLQKVAHKYGQHKANRIIERFGLDKEFGIHKKPTFPKKVD